MERAFAAGPGLNDCACFPRASAWGKITFMEDPWYHGGLRFRCTQCGHCCTGAPGYVWVNDEEIEAIAEFLGEPLEQTTAVHTRLVNRGRSLREKANGDCVFY